MLPPDFLEGQYVHVVEHAHAYLGFAIDCLDEERPRFTPAQQKKAEVLGGTASGEARREPRDGTAGTGRREEGRSMPTYGDSSTRRERAIRETV
jgi:hypothetical protein